MTVSVVLYFEIFFNSAFNGTADKWTHQFQSQYSIDYTNGAYLWIYFCAHGANLLVDPDSLRESTS